MAAPSYTYTLTNGNTADADEVMQNFNDILNGVSDGSKDLSISALTVAGAANFNGAVTLGNATGDDLTPTGRWAADMDPKTAATYALGSSSLPWQSVNVDNGATDGGAVYFGGSTTDFLKSSVDGEDLDVGGFSALDLTAGQAIKTKVSAQTGAYTITDTDGLSLIYVDADGAARDVTLPTASANTGRVITIKRSDTDAYAVTVKGEAAGETIDGISGTTGVALREQYDYITLQCDGSVWHIIDMGLYPLEWTSFTPSWSNWTQGNGTTEAYYKRVGDSMIIRAGFVMGSTSSIAGSIKLTIPNSLTVDTSKIPAPAAFGSVTCGTAHFINSGTDDFNGTVIYDGTTVVEVSTYATSSGYIAGGTINGSIPFTWATNDRLNVTTVALPITEWAI